MWQPMFMHACFIDWSYDIIVCIFCVYKYICRFTLCITYVEHLKMNSVKRLTESSDLKSIPSIYAYSTNSNEYPASDPQDSIPVIDFSLLTSPDPTLRCQVIQDLDKACTEWGFFQVLAIYLEFSRLKYGCRLIVLKLFLMVLNCLGD